MGFGILFFGYFTAFAFAMIPVYFFADIVGCLIMLWALTVLSSHKAAFRKCVYLDMVLTALSVVRAVGRTFAFFTDGDTVGTVLTVVWAAAALVFHFFLTGAIRSLAVDAEDKKMTARANFSRSFSVTAYVLMIAHSSLGAFLPEDLGQIADKLVLLVSLACLLFMSFLIYTSFVNFIPVSGEVPEPVPSKIPLVNKIRMKSYERKKRILDENRELYEEYLKNKKSKNEKTPKKRKKKK
ncbi:MAG: hypothetical protein IKN36_00745 [Clostridia bacterium]|nr:hypothetical protein [Clostridia bacterium]MBR7032024.1 hypothetical protein [Clostridia bacterium]